MQKHFIQLGTIIIRLTSLLRKFTVFSRKVRTRIVKLFS